jgi:hypothetical protein
MDAAGWNKEPAVNQAAFDRPYNIDNSPFPFADYQFNYCRIIIVGDSLYFLEPQDHSVPICTFQTHRFCVCLAPK